MRYFYKNIVKIAECWVLAPDPRKNPQKQTITSVCKNNIINSKPYPYTVCSDRAPHSLCSDGLETEVARSVSYNSYNNIFIL